MLTTVFHWACAYKGHLSLVKWFIEEKGFDPNYCPKGCQSAMAQAAGRGHRHILSYLFKKGGSPTLKDGTGEALSLLHWACQRGTVVTCEMVDSFVC